MKIGVRVSAFLRELKRRKVYRVTAVYLVLAIGGLELLDLLIPATTLPSWASPLLLGLAIVGLPVVVVLAWSFDLTPDGVVRTPDEVELGGADGTSDGSEDEADGGDEADRGDDLDPLTVAILPFDNLSGNPEAQPFATGLHDDLLTELSRASALTVISRTSVRSYQDSEKSLREIGKELGAGTIVEGGVQKSGDRVRLNVQLIDARTDAHLWAERYDRELTVETIFDLQSSLASSIMEALHARLTSDERSREHEQPTTDLEAYRLYALGREAFVDRSEEGMRRAVECFEKAIERDDRYALAWAGLGMANVALVDYGHSQSPELIERGRAACLRALDLDPELAEAHAAMGSLHSLLRHGPAARASLSTAIQLEPGLALGHQWASWVALLVGDPESSRTAALRATQLAPLDPEARGNLAMAHLALGDRENAAAEARRSLETHPEFAYARWVLGLALHGQDRHAEAVRELGALKPGGESSWDLLAPWAVMSEGLEAAARGDTPGARGAIERLDAVEAHFEAALLRAALGDLDRAFGALRSAHPLPWDEALALRYFRGPATDRLRRDGRYDREIAALDRNWGVEPDGSHD